MSPKRRKTPAGRRPAATKRTATRDEDARRRHRWFGGLSVAAVAGVVALLVSLTSVVDWVQDKVDPPKPAVIDARLLGVELAREREPLEDYLRGTRQSLEGLSGVERREQGLVFRVRVRLEGAIGKTFPLLWTMSHADGGRPLPDELYRQEALTFKPLGTAHARTWPIWVPYPPGPGRYQLDVVLADDKRQPVDERSSRVFRLRSVPAIN